MRLIDADALIEDVRKNSASYFADDFPHEWVDKQPTIEPKRKGKWMLAEDGWYCSACKLYPPFDCDPEEKGIPYCPWCGADMREEGDQP